MRKDIVVITGASAGVGRATSIKFASEGCKIGLIARGVERLLSTQKDVEEKGGKAIIIPGDVSDYNFMDYAAQKVEDSLGPITIWINNAMTTVFSEFKDLAAEDFKRVTEVTYLGFIYGTMAALKRMRLRNKGVILQVGSALAYRGIPLQSAYCGAKHAIQGFTESVRSELIHDNINIRLTMVQMPALNTPQFSWCKSNFNKHPQPVPPIYEPEIAAEAIYYSAYHKKREMYVGFRNSIIMYGNKFFPGFGDKYLAKNGYDSQMTDENIKASRPSNLWNPVEGDFGTRGEFSNKAIKKSKQVYLDTHPAITTFFSLVIIVVIILVLTAVI